MFEPHGHLLLVEAAPVHLVWAFFKAVISLYHPGNNKDLQDISPEETIAKKTFTFCCCLERDFERNDKTLLKNNS